MQKMFSKFAGLGLFAVAALAQAQDGGIRARVEAEMANGLHNAQEKARYDGRQPADVLEFFRLREDMRVIEMLPFGGWYTKLLGPILANKGKLYVTQPEVNRYSDMMREMLKTPGMEQVSVLDWNNRASDAGSAWVGTTGWNVEPVDLVLTFQNYHNFGYDDRVAINDATFRALKSGGYYGIVDHTRRHNEPRAQSNGRRVDPVLVIKEVEASGFEFVDYSNALYRPDDKLEIEVGQPQVSGNSDRFVLLFRKP